MSDLKPAHEVITGHIVRLCEGVANLDEGIAIKQEGPAQGSIVSLESLGFLRSSQMGKLAMLTDVIQEIVIPEDKLPWVIEQLARVSTTHLKLQDTVDVLTKRTPAASGS